MIATFDLERLHYASNILSAGIPEPDQNEIPADVGETLRMAKIQMESLPPALDDLEAAQREVTILDKSIDRLLILAREAAALPEDDQAGRDEREAEFVRLAKVVAGLAGRGNYSGPQLTLASRATAQGSYLTLKHLIPFKNRMAARLGEQKRMLIEAMGETLNFLETIVACFPQAASLSGIPNLLRRVVWIREIFPLDPPIEAGPPDGILH